MIIDLEIISQGHLRLLVAKRFHIHAFQNFNMIRRLKRRHLQVVNGENRESIYIITSLLYRRIYILKNEGQE